MSDAAVLVASGEAEQRLVPESRRRLFRRLLRDKASLLALVVIALFALAALLAPVIARHDPNQTDFLNRFAEPSAEHWLGTDHLGRDEFARILHGGRLSLGMALSATTGITVLGIALGLAAGVYGRFVETAIMRLVDILLSVPTLIQALVVVGLLGQGLRNLILTVILVQWPRYARLVRGMALKVREQTFVEAGRAAGGSRTRVMLRHILPNLIGPVVVFSTVDMGSTLLAVSSLSFLGFGVAPPAAEWGAMLSEARFQIERAPQLILYPGVAITLVVLAFNLAGDGLRDLLDPRVQAAPRGRKKWRLRRTARPVPPARVEEEPVELVSGSGLGF